MLCELSSALFLSHYSVHNWCCWNLPGNLLSWISLVCSWKIWKESTWRKKLASDFIKHLFAFISAWYTLLWAFWNVSFLLLFWNSCISLIKGIIRFLLSLWWYIATTLENVCFCLTIWYLFLSFTYGEYLISKGIERKFWSQKIFFVLLLCLWNWKDLNWRHHYC